MTLPRILVIDDQFGRSIKDRRNLCLNFGLVDVTGDDKASEEIKQPIAEAIFATGQRIQNDSIVNDADSALMSVKTGWPDQSAKYWSLVLLDIRFASGKIGKDGEPDGWPGDMDYGLRILEAIKKEYQNLPVVMLSARDRREIIEECRAKGAIDFIQRISSSSEDKSPKEILAEKLFQHGLLPDTRSLNDEKQRIAGNSMPILLALRAARRGATGTGNLLVIGETGTGKELLARYIHDLSPKSGGKYNIFHAFGTAETLQEDELFGHVKGAFTGATSDKEGLFESTNGGTLFIDEIGDIPESVQLKLLRPLESRIVSRQGSHREIHLDVQVVLATNKNLGEYSQTGKFKSDLLNRINAYSIVVPPLRERKEDIPLIAEQLVKNLCKEHNARWPRKIQPQTLELLNNHSWPDNVRELRNVLERAIKENKDSELLVPSDIRFDVSSVGIGTTLSKEPQRTSSVDSIDDLIDVLQKFNFPQEYGKLQGKLPVLQNAIARMMANYLESALALTKKMKPGGPSEGEINPTGAASCMLGEQIKTPKAADLVKKLLTMSPEYAKSLQKDSALKKAFDVSVRLRPKNQKAKLKRS